MVEKAGRKGYTRQDKRKEKLILPGTGYDQGQWKERELMLKGKRLMNTGVQIQAEYKNI